MELDNVEKALDDLAKSEGVSVKEIKAIICSLPIDKVKKHEAIVLMRIALREMESAQKEAKKKRREGTDSERSKAQAIVDFNAFRITGLLRKYNKLRGKDPKSHSLKKWGQSD